MSEHIKINQNSEFYQRIHKMHIRNGVVRKNYFVNEIKRFSKMQMSVDLDQLTIPPFNPEYTKGNARKPAENAVISHIKEKLDRCPLLDGLIPDPIAENPAHYEIQFNRDYLESLSYNENELNGQLQIITNI